MIGSFCPNILFPYARELISETICRGSFPPLYLAPINFDAFYEEKVKQGKK
jgi:preprotein translocase subunit SecB